MGCRCDNPLFIYAPATRDCHVDQQRLSRLGVRRAGLLLCAALLIAACAYARAARGDEAAGLPQPTVSAAESAGPPAPVPPQVHIDPKVVQLQVTEGTDIRFTRLSLA